MKGKDTSKIESFLTQICDRLALLEEQNFILNGIAYGLAFEKSGDRNSALKLKNDLEAAYKERTQIKAEIAKK